MSEFEPRPWEVARPIQARPGEVFHDADGVFYDVPRIVAEINADPERFKFCLIPTENIAREVLARGDLDLGWIEAMTPTDAGMPVLIGRYADGTTHLLAGYHRAYRGFQLGWDVLGAWLLTPEQTTTIMFRVDEFATV